MPQYRPSFPQLFTALVVLFLLGASADVLAKRTLLEITTPHFVIYTDSGKGDGKKIAAEFEQVRNAAEMFMPQYKTEFGKPIWILALHDVKALQKALPEEQRRRVYEGARISAKYLPALERDYLLTSLTPSGSTRDNRFELVYWGYIQAMNRHSFFNLPGWVNQGLAEFFKTIEIHSKRVDIGRPSVDMLRALQTEHLVPLEEIVNGRPRLESSEPDGLLRLSAQSWLLVHYLMLGEDPNRQRLQKYLTLLDQGAPESAARHALGSLEELHKKLEWYYRQNRFHYWSAQAVLSAEPDDFSLRELDGTDEDAVRALYILRQEQPEEARRVTTEAMARHSDRPRLIEAHGLVSYQLQREEEARAAFESLLKAEPDNALAHYFLGRMHAAEGPDEREQARRHLQACIEAQPQFAPAYAAMAGLPRTIEEMDEGLQYARKAAEFEPVNYNYLLTLGHMLLRAGYADSALQLARRLSQVQIPQVQSSAKRLLDEALKAKNAQD